MSEQRRRDGWVSVFSTATDYEAELVQSRLRDAGMEPVIHSNRDHAYNLNVGTMSTVNVMVAPDEEQQARELLASHPFSDEELTNMALRSDPDRPPDSTP